MRLPLHGDLVCTDLIAALSECFGDDILHVHSIPACVLMQFSIVLIRLKHFRVSRAVPREDGFGIFVG